MSGILDCDVTRGMRRIQGRTLLCTEERWICTSGKQLLEGRAGTSRAAQCNRSLDSGSFHLLWIVSALLGLFLGRIPLQTPSVKVPTRLFKSYFRLFSQIAEQVLPGFLDNLGSQILQSQGKKFASEKNGITLLFCTVLRNKEKKSRYLTRASPKTIVGWIPAAGIAHCNWSLKHNTWMDSHTTPPWNLWDQNVSGEAVCFSNFL